MYDIYKLLSILYFYYNIMQLLRNAIHLPAICFPLSMFRVRMMRLPIHPRQWYTVTGTTLNMWPGYTFAITRYHYYLLRFIVRRRRAAACVRENLGMKDTIVKSQLYLM